MCRLFAVTAGQRPIHLDYWLLDAPDSLLAESHRNPDGAGIGWFDDQGHAHVRKWGSAAFDTRQFSETALKVTATNAVTHVRAATQGADRRSNSHPFLIESRIMAHNGGFGDLPLLESHLGDYLGHVGGDTDSERFAALIAKETDAHSGDVSAGISAAARWIATELPMYSLNCVVATAGHLWALRYPDTRSLHVARRSVGDTSWEGVSSHSGQRVAPAADTSTPVVLVASERVDGSADWRMLHPGELLHVAPDLTITSTTAVPSPPRRFRPPRGSDRNDDQD
jgi:glutamine amidotransferase